MTHKLKILPKWYDDVFNERKKFEIRKNDRDFKVGDKLLLQEWEKGKYTGREMTKEIEYIYHGDGAYGVSESVCILGLKPLRAPQPKYINADEVVEQLIVKHALIKEERNADYDYTDIYNGMLLGIKSAQNIITDMPAADVRENTHGKNLNDEYAECDQFICSECGIELLDWHKAIRDEDGLLTAYGEFVFNFCPHCGADMRKGESE